jgi:DNA-directed RNA polymerase specialized sigma24 family protein
MLATVGVGEPPDRSLREAQREAVARPDWKGLLPKLERFVRSRGASSSSAKDAVHAVVTQLLDGRAAWNPAEGPDIARYLMAAVRSTLRHERRSARSRYETPSGILEDAPDPHADASSTPEAQEARDAARLARVRTALVKDSLALAILDLSTAGVAKPADQAARLGVAVNTVYDARDRLARCAKRIANEDAAEQKEESAE